MNEIEKLICGLPRPEPSTEFDSRIAQVFNRAARPNPRKNRWSYIGLLTACTACAALVGFVVGRKSVAPSIPSAQVSLQPDEIVTHSRSAAPRYVNAAPSVSTEAL